MELFVAGDYYIVQKPDFGLWCSRVDGSIAAKSGSEIGKAWNPICLGKIYGVIGKIKIHPDSDSRLLLIKEMKQLGELCGVDINQITKVVCLKLNREETEDIDIDRCEKHHFSLRRNDKLMVTGSAAIGFQKTWSSIKAAAETVKPRKQTYKDKERFVRKVEEELLQLFNESQCFYCSLNGDITSTLQKLQEVKHTNHDQKWALADDRFFWNKHMLEDLIRENNKLCNPWIVPVIQGFIQTELCNMLWDGLGSSHVSDAEDLSYRLWLISRRSRHRAGTRYKRRGVDINGDTANYVETEQILQFQKHTVSFVQVRGSVPIFWSQSGMKYRPPLVLDKDEESTKEAFKLHMEKQLNIYKKISLVNLVDQSGKEKTLFDEYLKHIMLLNSEKLTYITFDFHEYCRGMRFDHISILTDLIHDIVKEMKYCWVDSHGMICKQEGIFQSNCVDCLDRTNVFQSAIARIILETQCQKLGLLAPEEHLPSKVKHLFQQIWANNGDSLSRQYAGTAALKGDYTRTGERKLTGMMKDGMNSANRYYKNTFKDIYRQAMIDLMVGTFDPEDLNMGKNVVMDEMALLAEKGESVRTLVEECKKMVITDPEICLGAWPLIDADPWTGDPSQTDMDKILLLTQRAYYLVDYDDDTDDIAAYQRVYLEHIEKIELGLTTSLFRAKQMCLRIYYNNEGESGFFHMLRNSHIRLFNNKITTVTTTEDAKECLWIICHQFQAAWGQVSETPLSIIECKINRRRSKPHPWKSLSSQTSLALNKTPDVSRNSSTSDLKSLVPGAETVDTVRQSLLTVPRFIKKVAAKSKENLTIFEEFPKSKFFASETNGNTDQQEEDKETIDMHTCQSMEELDSPVTKEMLPSSFSTSFDHAVLDSCGILTIGTDQVLVKGHRLNSVSSVSEEFNQTAVKSDGYENQAFAEMNLDDEEEIVETEEEDVFPQIDIPVEESKVIPVEESKVKTNNLYLDVTDTGDAESQMKTSFSDGAISYSAQVDQVSVSVPTTNSANRAPTQVMASIRAKMQQLPKPGFQTAQSRRQQLLEIAKEKQEKSNLRFKNCKSRIILL